jgi:glutaconate CoA-transferase subunit B
MMRHQRRAFVERVDFLTSVGFGRNGGGRSWLGGAGPAAVITNLGVLRPDQQTKELILSSIHPRVEVSKVLEETGWNLKVADDLSVTPPPTDLELATLRELRRRTREAHSSWKPASG